MAATPQIIRVIDLETTRDKPPAHAVCKIGWQDVALKANGRWELEGEGGNRLINSGWLIPPLTMAVHHIRNEDVANAPWWHDVARPILDRGRAASRWRYIARHSRSNSVPPRSPAALTGSAPGNARCGYGPTVPASPTRCCAIIAIIACQKVCMEHGRGLPAHRAFPDAYVTTFHLRDMLNQASVAQLIEWSKLSGLLPRVRYGPDRGKEWSEIDDDVLDGFPAGSRYRHPLHRAGRAAAPLPRRRDHPPIPTTCAGLAALASKAPPLKGRG